MILMHEDWHRDTLEWSWICGRGTVAFTKRPLRNPTSGFLSRKEGRERERVYIIRGTGRQGELYGEPRRTTAIRHYISASRIYTAGPMIDAGDRGRQWPVNELTRIRYAIEDFERELLGFWWIFFVSWTNLVQVPLFLRAVKAGLWKIRNEWSRDSIRTNIIIRSFLEILLWPMVMIG